MSNFRWLSCFSDVGLVLLLFESCCCSTQFFFVLTVNRLSNRSFVHLMALGSITYWQWKQMKPKVSPFLRTYFHLIFSHSFQHRWKRIWELQLISRIHFHPLIGSHLSFRFACQWQILWFIMIFHINRHSLLNYTLRKTKFVLMMKKKTNKWKWCSMCVGVCTCACARARTQIILECFNYWHKVQKWVTQSFTSSAVWS